MRHQEFIKKFDVLSLEAPFYEVPLRREYLLKHIGRGKRVLDLGCSGGQLTKLIQNQNNDVFAIELNPRAVKAAQARGIKVKAFDLNEGIPYPDGHFDVVHAGHILEHLYDGKFLLEECNRVLKPGGVLLLAIHNINSLENRFRILRGQYPSLIGAYPEDHSGEKLRIYNHLKIEELCSQTGFEAQDFFGVPNRKKQSLAYKLLRHLVRFAPYFGEVLLAKARKKHDL